MLYVCLMHNIKYLTLCTCQCLESFIQKSQDSGRALIQDNKHTNFSAQTCIWCYPSESLTDFKTLWGSEHSLHLPKEYYTTVQRNLIRMEVKKKKVITWLPNKLFKLFFKRHKPLQCLLLNNQYGSLSDSTTRGGSSMLYAHTPQSFIDTQKLTCSTAVLQQQSPFLTSFQFLFMM